MGRKFIDITLPRMKDKPKSWITKG